MLKPQASEWGGCGRQNNGPSKTSTCSSLEPVNPLPYLASGFRDVNKVKDLEMGEIILDHPDEPNLTTNP